jgi:hypothetical protein
MRCVRRFVLDKYLTFESVLILIGRKYVSDELIFNIKTSINSSNCVDFKLISF